MQHINDVVSTTDGNMIISPARNLRSVLPAGPEAALTAAQNLYSVPYRHRQQAQWGRVLPPCTKAVTAHQHGIYRANLRLRTVRAPATRGMHSTLKLHEL